MKLPFLRYLPGLGSPPVRQVVGGPGTPATAALHYLLSELPELLLAAVLDLPTGQLLATYAAERGYQPSLLATPVAAVVQLLQQQSPAPEQPAEILLTLASQLHLVRLRPGSQQVLFLAIGSHDTNLALLRQLAENAVQLLETPA
jgi:hypothetical protein